MANLKHVVAPDLVAIEELVIARLSAASVHPEDADGIVRASSPGVIGGKLVRLLA
jgi:hypothetical protein